VSGRAEVGRVGAAAGGEVVTAVVGGFDGDDDDCGADPVGSSVGEESPREHPATAMMTATTAKPTLTPT
jgi:hypothetical protein